MRAVPLMRVEVDGEQTRRPGVLNVLRFDLDGKPSVVHLRPELLPGEVLIERPGQIPAIISKAVVGDLADIYRHQAIRAVTGAHPAMMVQPADPVALNCLSRRLADSSMAMELMRAKGYGRRGDSLVEMIKGLPEAARKK